MTIQEKKIIEKHFDSFKSYYQQDLTNLDIYTKIQKTALQSFFKALHTLPDSTYFEEKLATVCLRHNALPIPLDQTSSDSDHLELSSKSFFSDLNGSSHLGVCNLVDQTKLKNWHPVVEREDLVQSLIHKILSTTYNNVLILGPFQSGKKSLVYGLAQRIARSEVPLKLKNAKILDVCMALERSGGMSRALLDLMDESNVIYFISSLDRLEDLKQLTPEISDLVITRIFFYNNPVIICNKKFDFSRLSIPLKNRMIVFNIIDPSEQQAIEIMKLNAKRFEKIHNCTFSEAIIKQIYNHLTNAPWFFSEYAKIDRLMIFMDFAGSVVEAKSETLTPIAQVTIDDIKTVLKEHSYSERKKSCPSYIS